MTLSFFSGLITDALDLEFSSRYLILKMFCKVSPYGVPFYYKLNLLFLIFGITKHINVITGPGNSVGRVSAPGNGRSRVRSRGATYQSR